MFFKSKITGSDSQVWNFCTRIPGNQDISFSKASRMSCYIEVKISGCSEAKPVSLNSNDS